VTPSVEEIRDALAAHLSRQLPLEGLTPAAVLLPLLLKDGEPHLLFTRRADTLSHHRGEISFPGGVAEPADAGLQQTALRETHEELGIEPADVQLLGQLDDFVSIHGYRVTPFAGRVPWPYRLQVQASEIAEVLEVPLAHLRNPAIHRQEDWSHKGRVWPIHFYRWQRRDIWGLTAAILRQFLQRLDGLL